MAKKKGKAPKKGPKGKGRAPKARPTAPEGLPPDLPPWESIEAMMSRMVGGASGAGGGSKLDRAQEVMYDAFEETDPRKRVSLAKKALKLSPDCADAYVVLAESARSQKEALESYQKGVEAGERALGPEAFVEGVGDFWGLLETRPYMRARLGLADTLWSLGRREEAVGHFQEMLRLNPNDNQGIRYLLAPRLLELGRDDDLEALLTTHKEDGSASWAYNRALLAFRRGGDSAEARKRLKEARKVNAHVPDYLTGKEPLPDQPPPYYSFGDPSEAVIYAAEALGSWRATPGAVTWLRGSAAAPKKKKASKRSKAAEPEGPLPLVRERLRRVPQVNDAWQVGCRLVPLWIETDGEPLRPRVILVLSPANDLILAHGFCEGPPGPEQLWDILANAIQTPAMGDPQRPIELQVAGEAETWKALEGDLEEIGITLTAAEDTEQLDSLLDDLLETIAADAPPSLLEMPGIQAESVGRFYEAAAGFFRRAPWRSIGPEQVIRVASEAFESGPWYAIVMGQSGLTLGLTLYEDIDLLRRMWAGRTTDEENARETVALTVTFDARTDLPPAEVDAIEQHGWEVAAPEAYPSIFRKERGMSMRPPLAWELQLMEGCLRALPDFAASTDPEDVQEHRVRVPVASGTLELVLSWIDEG